jgi:predicted DNA repair protein MutK
MTIPVMIASGGLFLMSELSAAETVTKNFTAMEKMRPDDQVPKMQACNKRAIDEKIKMADRTRFIQECISK